MQTKLTLRLDHELIEQAKIFAHQQNKSLSQLGEEYFLLLTKTVEETGTEECFADMGYRHIPVTLVVTGIDLD